MFVVSEKHERQHAHPVDYWHERVEKQYIYIESVVHGLLFRRYTEYL